MKQVLLGGEEGATLHPKGVWGTQGEEAPGGVVTSLAAYPAPPMLSSVQLWEAVPGMGTAEMVGWVHPGGSAASAGEVTESA